jgi:hypothetical protein
MHVLDQLCMECYNVYVRTILLLGSDHLTFKGLCSNFSPFWQSLSFSLCQTLGLHDKDYATKVCNMLAMIFLCYLSSWHHNRQRNVSNRIKQKHAAMTSVIFSSNNISSEPLTSEFEYRSDKVYSIQHYVIKFVSELQQVCGFLRVLKFIHQ